MSAVVMEMTNDTKQALGNAMKQIFCLYCTKPQRGCRMCEI